MWRSKGAFGIGYLVITASVIGCSGGGDEDVVQESLPQVNQSKGFDGPLTLGSAGKADRFIKNGIYAATLSASEPTGQGDNSMVPSTSFDNTYSTTNTIEQGVDEADRVKYDGDTLFLASFANWSQSETEPTAVRVLKRNTDYSLTQVDNITFTESFQNIEGLYLYQQRLASIGIESQVYPVDALSIAPWEPTEPKVSVAIHDVSNVNDISQITELQIDGSLLSSRRVEGNLYLVSSYVPYVNDLAQQAISEEQKRLNYQRVSQLSSASIMPKMRVDGQAIAMNDINQCYIPQQATEQDGHAQILTVTRVNLTEPTDTESLCMSIQASMLYMSEQSLYLTEVTSDDKTVFHKVSLEGLSYLASGSVDGLLGWRSNPLFKVDEQGNYLRVVSTKYDQAEPVHQLTVLSQQGNQLSTVARLPDSTVDEPIGKPGEEIYAVRFIDDKAFIVTFETIDPLYVIDLSDNQAPFIAGSIEIPGFSSYLQPLSNDLLLGIGQQVNLDDLPTTGEPVTLPVIPSGLKISLFDIKDPANPIELDTLFAADAYTPVEFNYKALSVLQSGDDYRFAMPVERWVVAGEPDSQSAESISLAQNSLMLLQTNTSDVAPKLGYSGSVEAASQSQFYVYAGNDRSILHGDKVYYIRGNEVWLSSWLNVDVVEGPF